MEIQRYVTYFATLIIMELEAEKGNKIGNGLLNAMKTLKNIDATANFGKF